MDKCDSEDGMDTPSKFHMRESYVLKSQSHDHDTTTFVETLSGENLDEYFKGMDDKNKNSYDKGHMGDCFKWVNFLSQCASSNMVFK